MQYVGRFAPSPTGPLHFGSLLAAVASYADALAHNGRWLVRMEDVDEPRSQPGAAEHILRTLEQYGFRWDGEVVVQSARKHLYENALERLNESGAVFACSCTRKMLEIQPQNISGERMYPGTCLRLPPPGGERFLKLRGEGVGSGHASAPSEKTDLLQRAKICLNFAIRLQVPAEIITWNDRHLGPQSQHLSNDVGAFIIKRSDGLFAYQLAVVVDDAAQGMTHIVRGADLLTSTARQIYLQKILGLNTPQYLHIPVAVNGRGEKLSKQTLAPALDAGEAALPTLHAAWRALNQVSATHVRTIAAFWEHAASAWSAARLPHMLTLSV